VKGVIFSEMIRWVEECLSPAVADRMITGANLPNEGSYTSVGSYPHQEALAMMGQLVEITGRPAHDLCHDYGYWLATRFIQLYPQMFNGYTDALTLLRDIDNKHNTEVIKLYPDARTPAIIASVDGEDLVISYASHRPFADVAWGLVHGYIAYYGQTAQYIVTRDETTPGPHAARFVINRA
jgi:hypothetical protein